MELEVGWGGVLFGCVLVGRKLYGECLPACAVGRRGNLLVRNFEYNGIGGERCARGRECFIGRYYCPSARVPYWRACITWGVNLGVKTKKMRYNIL